MKDRSGKEPKKIRPDPLHGAFAHARESSSRAGSPVSGPDNPGQDQVLEALKENEAVLRSFFDSSGVMRGIVEVISEDDVRHITDNAAMASFVGLTPGEMKNKLGSELGEPRDILRMWVGHYTESKKNGKPGTFEYADQRGKPEAWLLATVSYLGTPPGGFPRYAYVILDITERKRAEAALRESEERMRFALEISNTGAWDLNLGDHTSCRSLDHDRIFGYETILPEWTYEMFLDHVLPEDRALVDAKFRHATATGGDWNFECRIRRTDGVIRWIWAAGRHRPGAPGGADRIAGIVQDITVRKESEEALRESRKKYQSLVEASIDSIWEIDTQGRFTYCSPQMQTLWGINPEQMIGKTPFDLMSPHEGERARDTFMKISGSHDRIRGLEYEAFDGTGNPIILEISGVPFFDASGALLGYRGISRDITEQKRAQEAMLRARNDLEIRVEERTAELNDALASITTERHRLYEVLDSLPAYVCLLDDDYRMPFANKYFRKTFREPEGRRCYEFLFNRTEPCEICESYTVMKTRAPHHWYWTGPNGRDYDIYDFPFTDSDGSFRILEMGIDITERVKAEEERSVLASIVEHTDDAIIGKTLDGTIVSWNAGAEKMYGYSAGEVTGRHISILQTPEEKYDMEYILDQIRNGEPVLRYSTNRMRKDGKIIPVSLTISPIKDRNGLVTGASTIARDITEQQKAQKEIENAYAYNRSLIEASLDPLVTISPAGTISDVNEATIRVTGFSRSELIGTDFSDYFTEPEIAKAGYEKVFRDGSVTDYPLEIRHREGRVTPVLYNAAVYRDVSGTVIGVFAAARDITGQKQAEDAVRRANAYNRSLIEASLDPLVTISPAGTISDVNEATIQVTGFSRSELIGTDFSDYFTEPDKAKAGYERAFRDGSVIDYPLDIRHREGYVTPVLYNASVYRDPTGKVTGVFAAARDVTERKKAEEMIRKEHELLEVRVNERTAELAESNALLEEEISQREDAESLVKKTISELQAAIESTADGIYAVDRAGKISRYNQNFSSMWKIPEELLVSGEDSKVAEFMRSQVKNPGLVANITENADDRDHEVFDMLELNDGRIFERYSKPQKMESTIIGRVMSYRDITDRRRAEEKLLASLDEKETLIREIHHRVKNNLQIISGLLDMTRMRTADRATSSILTDMMLKIKTMAQIHTRLYESKQFDRINMGSQIRDQVADLSSIYGQSGARILSDIEVQDIYLPVDQAIPCALIVNEILSNSFKHAFRGRKQGMVTVSASQDTGTMNIIIRDDGIGIPPDVDVRKTSSLGLKLIRNLVLQLGGSVTITSRNGTEVGVEFPLHPKGG